MDETRKELILLHAELAGMTKDRCDSCTDPQRSEDHRCCHGWACELAMQYSEWRWGIELHPTGHPDLPLMGPGGCVAPPHLRPACSGHVCLVTAQSACTDWRLKVGELRRWAAELEAGLVPVERDPRNPR
jgi:hypothetical protein